MKILETVILVFALLFGLIGRVPDFSKKVWKIFWRVYWTLAATSLLVLVWVELPRLFFNVFLALGFAWLWIPIVVGEVFLAGAFVYCIGYLAYWAGVAVFMFVKFILLGLYWLIFDPMIERVSDKRMMRVCENIISGKLSVSEEKAKSAECILSNLRIKYHIGGESSSSIVQNDELIDVVPNDINKEL